MVRRSSARTRLQGYFVWDILDFIINAILFVLIGLQLRVVVDGLSGYSATTLGGYALAVTGVVVGTRLGWFFTVPYLIRAIDRRPTQRARRVGPRWRLVLAWSGMRGAVSLAVALALPFTTNTGSGFPLAGLPADAAARAQSAARGAFADAQQRGAVQRDDEPDPARARP